jgi:hypothetical protein
VRHRSSRQSRANRRRQCWCNGDSDDDDGDESPWEWKTESNNKRRVHEWKIENCLIISIRITNNTSIRAPIKDFRGPYNLRPRHIVCGTDWIFRNDENSKAFYYVLRNDRQFKVSILQ